MSAVLIGLYVFIAVACMWKWLPAVHRCIKSGVDYSGDTFGPKGDAVYALILTVVAGAAWPVRVVYLVLAWIAQSAMKLRGGES